MRNSNETSRSERRHHVQRLKRSRRNYWNYPDRYAVSALDHPPVSPQPMPADVLGKVVDTPCTCSCPGCGNSRRHAWFKGDRITQQEKRYLVQYREQLDELSATVATDDTEDQS